MSSPPTARPKDVRRCHGRQPPTVSRERPAHGPTGYRFTTHSLSFVTVCKVTILTPALPSGVTGAAVTPLAIVVVVTTSTKVCRGCHRRPRGPDAAGGGPVGRAGSDPAVTAWVVPHPL